MNNKEFLEKLSNATELPAKEMQHLSGMFSSLIADTLEDGDVLTVQNFGNFEVKKKMERIVVNPSTKQRMLVPPKLAMSFKPGAAIKEKFKNK